MEIYQWNIQDWIKNFLIDYFQMVSASEKVQYPLMVKKMCDKIWMANLKK